MVPDKRSRKRIWKEPTGQVQRALQSVSGQDETDGLCLRLLEIDELTVDQLEKVTDRRWAEKTCPGRARWGGGERIVAKTRGFFCVFS